MEFDIIYRFDKKEQVVGTLSRKKDTMKVTYYAYSINAILSTFQNLNNH